MSLNSSGLQQSRLAVQVGVSGSSSNFSDAEKPPVSATRNLKHEAARQSKTTLPACVCYCGRMSLNSKDLRQSRLAMQVGYLKQLQSLRCRGSACRRLLETRNLKLLYAPAFAFLTSSISGRTMSHRFPTTP